MAKIGLTKLQLKKNTNLIFLNWNDQVIEIKEYLPILDKTIMIEKIVNQSLDDNNFANPARIEINMVLETMFAYTNINFTDKQKEDKLALYDLLVSSGLWKAVKDELDKVGELNIIQTTIHEIINEVYKYKNSLLGILEAANQDYNNLNLEAEEIEKKIANKENIELLDKVIKQLG